MDPKGRWKAAVLAAIIAQAALCADLAKSADINAWEKTPWGASKSVALKVLQHFHVHECRRAAACGDELIIDSYTLSGVSYEVDLAFSTKYGLSRVRMTAADGRDAFRNVLAGLTRKYGKPRLDSGYDGAQEAVRTEWTWIKPHGKVSLASDDSAETGEVFTITYEMTKQ
ncbi:MAG TPA: hypothetical protein VH639_20195 [Bryobacteraceae bacterium]|jgi:hypothetical protein